MSILKSRAKEIFQKPPCEENGFISFDDEAGCIKAFVSPGGNQALTDARNKILMEYDAAVKESFGDNHFHGEEGIPLALPVRMALGWC